MVIHVTCHVTCELLTHFQFYWSFLIIYISDERTTAMLLSYTDTDSAITRTSQR